MANERDEAFRGSGPGSMRRAVRTLADAAVDGLHAPDDRLAGKQRQGARDLAERIATVVHQDVEKAVRRDRQEESTLRQAVTAATALFEAHPLTAGELVTLDLDADRATRALVTEGEPVLTGYGPAVADWCRERIVPRVVQSLLS